MRKGVSNKTKVSHILSFIKLTNEWRCGGWNLSKIDDLLSYHSHIILHNRWSIDKRKWEEIIRVETVRQKEVNKAVDSRSMLEGKVMLQLTSSSLTLNLINKRRSEREINTYYLLLTIVLIFSTLFTQWFSYLKCLMESQERMSWEMINKEERQKWETLVVESSWGPE